MRNERPKLYFFSVYNYREDDDNSFFLDYN